MPIAQVGRIKMYYEREGKGHPVLFISGLSGGQRSWVRVVEYLKRDYECITFDNRGIGRGSKPRGGYSMHNLVKDTLGLLDSLSISRTHIVGQSMGGMIGQMIAAQQPERVGKLVVVASLAKSYPLCNHILQARKILRRHLKPYDYAWVTAAWFLGNKALSKPGYLDEHAKRAAANPFPQTLYAYDQLVDAICSTEFDSRPLLKKISQPTLVICGEKDALTRPQESQYLADHIANAKLIIMPETGHACTSEDPKGFSDLVANFLG